jgi:hypothetical protein
MTKETQRPWPRVRDTGVERRAPTAFFAAPDGYLKSERSLAGPLRMGTAPGIGPRGAIRNGSSDFGMDRLEMKPVDRCGVKYPEVDPPVPMVSRELRNSNRRSED